MKISDYLPLQLFINSCQPVCAGFYHFFEPITMYT